ncbi:hypothetical protein, partial [Burkholderia sp. Ac-20379]|uniref:hypothetical protein n=1 Tax=Burkholderia sp. Ac-20379 TaxID=2703900 RepID=UPI001980CA22
MSDAPERFEPGGETADEAAQSTQSTHPPAPPGGGAVRAGAPQARRAAGAVPVRPRAAAAVRGG